MKTHVLALCLLVVPLAVQSDEHLPPPPSQHVPLDLDRPEDQDTLIDISCALTAGDISAASAVKELDCLVDFLGHFEKNRRRIARSGHDVDAKYLKEARQHKAQAVLRIKTLTSWLGKLDTSSRKP